MQNAAKNKSFSLAGLMALRVLLLLVVALCLGQTRVWGFAVTPQPASGVFESVTPSSTGENYDGCPYDASDSLLAARGVAGAGDEIVTVFRGVHAEHIQLGNALQGKAAPWGGHSDPVLHNAWDNRSIFTSWTTDQATAVRFATENGPGGVMLRQTVPRSSLIKSPDALWEFEVLRTGPINGATPIILSK